MRNCDVYIFVIILFTCLCEICFSIQCRSETDKDIDWFVNYKLPKIEDKYDDSNLSAGKAYAYITSPGSSSWKLSSKSITEDSMLKNTMDNFYSDKKKLTFLLYNDDPPSSFNGTAVGHLKGVLVFDEQVGFWLIHSIPKFANDQSYEYPNNALPNGQSILCVTFETKELNEIAHQLLYSHPNIYSYFLTDEVREQLDDTAQTLFSDKPSFVKREPLTRTADLKSLSNKKFVSFSKDNQFNHDLYDSVIGPGLKSSLLVETWRRGSGTVLPPNCQTTYTVRDVLSINMTVGNRRNKRSIFFQYTEDHSKWAISDDESKKSWICVGDMNRMKSQERRGGGALCFISKPVRSAYRSIETSDLCPV